MLRSISDDSRYASKLDTFRLSTYYMDSCAQCAPPDELQARKFAEYLQIQIEFLGGDDMGLLSVILNKLPAITRIEVGEICHHAQRDFTRPYGIKTFEEESGCRLYPDPFLHFATDQCPLTHTFRSVLRALSILRKPIQELLAFRYLKNGVDSRGVNMDAMPQLKGYYRSHLKVVLADLRRLELQVRYDTLGVENVEWLTQFVTLAPRLRYLHLSFDFNGHHGNYFPAGVPAAAALKIFCDTVRLPHLEKLKISSCRAHAQDLVTLCKSHATSLRTFTINRVLLADGSWSERFFPKLDVTVSNQCMLRVAWLMQLVPEPDDDAALPDMDVLLFHTRPVSGCERCSSDESQQYTPETCEHVSAIIDFSADARLPEYTLVAMGESWDWSHE
ncbi:hypothetical protein LTR56_013428 [Elasticomyces elasticus]|nr:hypothetical protein LTR22_025165 [Elasticomyces elasticus]KAK3637825.1 hypothetical protein LTR56_013428 [Elasticomyces elasticus]KAK4905067.1 hypothetical protein LTR49_025595 [Elasticomyces elasticus]KAK5753888.1 hypothetical protein LTS12_015980 [Elasticomyces elasticus]